MSKVKEEQNLIKTEVAKRYRVKPRSIELWVAADKFPRPLKPGHRTALWAKTDLDEYDALMKNGKTSKQAAAIVNKKTA